MTAPILSRDTLHGVWAAVPTPWTEDDRFDEPAFRANVRALCRAGVHGVYTTGSTGEFYALDFDEFRLVAAALTEEARPFATLTQVGCGAPATRQTLRQLEFAAECGASGGQVALPYWMELSDAEVLGFFRDLTAACPGFPLVHYNIPRAKRYLTAGHYLRVVEAAPHLVGVKFTFAGANFASLIDATQELPGLSFFVGENLLASGMAVGARGTYSSLALMNPGRMLRFYEACATGDWALAFATQAEVARFFREAAALWEEQGLGLADPVVDKGMATAAGFMVGHQRTRAPYTPWPDEGVRAFAAWLDQRFPEWRAAG